MWLVATAIAHPKVAGLRIVLGTRDAHGLYERFGFQPVNPGRMMERIAPGGPATTPGQVS